MIDAYKAWLSEPIETKRTIISEIGRQKQIGDLAIEKDYWVSVLLQAIFSLPYGKHFVFKGGTSLSKGWNLINRFSEDIDLAIDREYLGFGGDLDKKGRTKLRKASKVFIEETLSKDLEELLNTYGFGNVCKVSIPETHESDLDPVVLYVKYNSIIEDRPQNGYMQDQVKIEISCRSMMEPFENKTMRSMVSAAYPNEPFAEDNFFVQTVTPTRTFLEKIFLLHEEYTRPGGCTRCYRLTRHIYDIEKMMDNDFAKKALYDKDLYIDIVKHRKQFTAWSGLDYNNHNPSKIVLTPPETI